jgi:ABC-type Fe3+ transport system permease subunit
VARGGNGGGVGAVLAGLASVATLPLAIFLTRFSDSYELLHAALAIPLAAVLGFVALTLARRSRRKLALSLSSDRRDRAAVAGRLLGIAGICIALAAVVALGVYGLLEYVGSRD